MNAVGTFLAGLLQVKISFIGWKNGTVLTFGKSVATKKLIEISLALLTFGIRITLRW